MRLQQSIQTNDTLSLCIHGQCLFAEPRGRGNNAKKFGTKKIVSVYMVTRLICVGQIPEASYYLFTERGELQLKSTYEYM